jgi:hypothetical protein
MDGLEETGVAGGGGWRSGVGGWAGGAAVRGTECDVASRRIRGRCCAEVRLLRALDRAAGTRLAAAMRGGAAFARRSSIAGLAAGPGAADRPLPVLGGGNAVALGRGAPATIDGSEGLEDVEASGGAGSRESIRGRSTGVVGGAIASGASAPGGSFRPSRAGGLSEAAASGTVWGQAASGCAGARATTGASGCAGARATTGASGCAGARATTADGASGEAGAAGAGATGLAGVSRPPTWVPGGRPGAGGR